MTQNRKDFVVMFDRRYGHEEYLFIAKSNFMLREKPDNLVVVL
jgi:hypothetical protein